MALIIGGCDFCNFWTPCLYCDVNKVQCTNDTAEYIMCDLGGYNPDLECANCVSMQIDCGWYQVCREEYCPELTCYTVSACSGCSELDDTPNEWCYF